MEIRLLDHGYCNFIENWGSDERIIESARMSTSGSFKGWGPIHEAPEVCRLHPQYCKCKVKDGDERLLRYLWENKHYTPFEMAGLTVEVQAPVFVLREWHRHRTQSYNELSARYTELPNLYYIPSIERLMAGKQSKKNKQGSAEGFSMEEALILQTEIELATGVARKMYEDLLGKGVSRELARVVIPVNQYTRMRASANLRNWLAFLTLRLDISSQWEIRQYAEAMGAIVKAKFPRTYALFETGR